MSYYKTIFAFLTWLVVAAAIGAEPIDYYKRLALAGSPRLKAGEANAAAANSTYLKESIFKENPDVMIGLMNVPVNSFPALNRDTMSGFVVGFSQKLALPWESHYRKEASRQRAETEARDQDLLVANLIWEVSEKYNTLQYSYHRLVSLREGRSIMRNNLNILARSVKLQRNIVPQILEAKANLTLIDNEAITLEYEIEKLWLELEVLCGSKLAHTISDAEKHEWLSAYDGIATPREFQLADNFQYRKVRAQVDAQTAMLSLSHSSLFPEVTLSAAYAIRQQVPGAYTGSTQASMGENMISVYASTPLPVFYPLKNKHDIDAQAEKAKAAELVLHDTALALESVWKAETLKMETLKRTIENYTKSILPAHSSAHKAHLATATAQGMGVSEALAAYQMVITSTQDRLKKIRDYYSSYYKLQFLASKQVSNVTP